MPGPMQSQMLPGPDTPKPKKVWYEGTDTILPGYALCGNRAYGTATTSEPSRGVRAEKPAAGNLRWFLGVVAEGRPGGYAGPCAVPIIEPTGNMARVYTSETAVTIGAKLCVVAGSYYLQAKGTGVQVATARQTIAAAGLILAQIDGPVRDEGIATDAGAGPSPTLWDSCPWEEMQRDPTLGHTYWNDYHHGFVPLVGTSTTEICEWIQTEVTSGLTALVTNFAGGALRVSSEANVTADDGLCVMYRDVSWVPAAGKRIWFEARIRMTDIDTTPDQFFIGLTGLATEMLAGGTIDDAKDKIGFFTHSGSTVATLEFITAKTSVEEITTGAATGLVDAAWVKVGFIADLATVSPYVNGVVGTAHATTTKLPTAGTGLGLCYSACVDQTSAPATLDIDWVRIAQLR